MISYTPLLTACILSLSFYSTVAQNITASGPTAQAGTSPTSTTSPTSSSPTGSTPTGSGGTSSIAALAAGLSSSCQTAAGSLLTSEFGSCANVIGLASVVTGTGSIVTPLNTWITSLCSADPCSNGTLTSAKQTLSTGCGADAQKGSPIASGLTSIIENFGSARNMLCSQYVSNSTFCVPSLFDNMQNAGGANLTIASILSLFSTGFSGSTFSKFPPSSYCNDCGHAIMTLAVPFTSSANSSMAASMAANHTSMDMSHNTSDSVGGACGAAFSDGKIPSSVRIAAKGSSAASSNAQNSAGVRATSSTAAALLAPFVLFSLYFAC